MGMQYLYTALIVVERCEVVKMGLAKAFEQVADEIAGIVLIVGGIYLLKTGLKTEGMSLVNLGAIYLFYRRVYKKPMPQTGGLPYGQ